MTISKKKKKTLWTFNFYEVKIFQYSSKIQIICLTLLFMNTLTRLYSKRITFYSREIRIHILSLSLSILPFARWLISAEWRAFIFINNMQIVLKFHSSSAKKKVGEKKKKKRNYYQLSECARGEHKYFHNSRTYINRI